MTNLIGQSLGRYHILEQLGEGGMATVFKAYDTRLEREVAVKIILPGKAHTEKFLKRFDLEAKSLARLNHPNILKVIDFGEHEGFPFLVMDYVSGGTLKQKLVERSLNWQEAVRLLIPIAIALDYAHRKKVVHRDVKPANILISSSGEPILSDFGIAKLLEAEETLDLTGTGVGVGTPEYMAPEQAQGKLVDGRSDVYSLGVVLFEMVTRRKPYQADTPYAVVIKHVNEPIPDPKVFATDLPVSVQKLIYKALAKDPHNRFQNMDEFRAALETSLTNIEPNKPKYKFRIVYALAILVTIAVFGVLAGLFQKPIIVKEARVTQVTQTSEPAPSLAPIAYYDDFQDPTYDSVFNSDLWGLSSGSAKAIQKDGTLVLEDLAPTIGEGMILTPILWNSSSFSEIEIKVKANRLQGTNGNITIDLFSTSFPGGWVEFGILADGNKASICACRNDVSKSAQIDTWYVLKITYDQSNNLLTYFVDGEKFFVYKLPISTNKITPKIQMWHPWRVFFWYG